jgi:ribosomal protein S18 acetylase RimI-like enzyme
MFKQRKIDLSDLNEIKRLIDASLGNEYISIEILHKYIDNNNFGFVMTADENVVGFVLNDIKSLKELGEELSLDYKILSNISPENKVGLINVIVTDEKYQNKGIASELIKTSLDYYSSNNIENIYVEAWKTSTGQINIGNIMDRHNFKQIFEIENYWKDDSLKYGFDCSFCGFPCVCSAIIYCKSL